jgi:phosphohistidine swiveling domain-containing protein
MHEDIKSILERHFKDAVDFEFTIQDGELWILNARPAKRTSQANLKITIDLYSEGIIDDNDAIERIKVSDIETALAPQIINESGLQKIGIGLPACAGVATGQIYFFEDDIVTHKREKCILCRTEVSPEDLLGMNLSTGIITTRGGMTSHAAVVARRMGKPCVSGIGILKIDYGSRKATINELTLNEGDWVTINGSAGFLYLGKGQYRNPDWRENKILYLFSRIIEKTICTNILKDKNIGTAWIIRDFFLHNIPLFTLPSAKKSVNIRKYVSFVHPNQKQLSKIYSNLKMPYSNEDNIRFIIRGLRNTLLRQLTNKIGIGNHYKFYRPILDPMLCIKNKLVKSWNSVNIQLVGEEFYDISKYLPNLIDIYNVKIFMEIEVNSDDHYSFLDFTNINGESLVVNDTNILRYYIEINEQEIEENRLPSLYNVFRKREYFWTWYSENKTSHEEMICFLKKSNKERIDNFRLNTYAHELELLENNTLTNSGKHLIS